MVGTEYFFVSGMHIGGDEQLKILGSSSSA
jgi:hypothetical protein